MTSVEHHTDVATGVQPVVLGYLCPAGDHHEQARRACELGVWAHTEGMTIGGVHGDDDPDVPAHTRPGLMALLDQLASLNADGSEPAGVVVSSLDALGAGEVQRAALRRLVESTGGRLHVLPPTS